MSKTEFINEIEAAVRLKGYPGFMITDLKTEDMHKLKDDLYFCTDFLIESHEIPSFPGHEIYSCEFIDNELGKQYVLKKLRVQFNKWLLLTVRLLVLTILSFYFSLTFLPILFVLTLAISFVTIHLYFDIPVELEKQLLIRRIYMDMPIIVMGNTKKTHHKDGYCTLYTMDANYLIILIRHEKDPHQNLILRIILEKGYNI